MGHDKRAARGNRQKGMRHNVRSTKAYLRFCRVKLVIAVISILCIVLEPKLPQRRLAIHPNSDHTFSLYADSDWGGRSTSEWVNEEEHHWRCQLAHSQLYPVCGISVLLTDKVEESVDFTRFHTLELDMRYLGDSPNLRVYLRNYNPKYSEPNDNDSHKFNFFNVNSANLKNGKPIAISLTAFTVAEWWLKERNVGRELTGPEMDRVVAVGIDLPAPHTIGTHDIYMNRITLVGSWINRTTMYLWLALFWIAIATAEAIYCMLSTKKPPNL